MGRHDTVWYLIIRKKLFMEAMGLSLVFGRLLAIVFLTADNLKKKRE